MLVVWSLGRMYLTFVVIIYLIITGTSIAPTIYTTLYISTTLGFHRALVKKGCSIDRTPHPRTETRGGQE